MKNLKTLWKRTLFAGACLGAASAAPAPVKILLVGDSTVTDVAGWAPGFRVALEPGIECVNLSQSGRSSKSYRDEGWWKGALAAKADYVLIQFGHNDVSGKGPARQTDAATTFRANLARYVEEAEAAGMKPILVTSIAHRDFGADGKLKPDALEPYVAATRAVAARERVPLIDLYALTRAWCQKEGPEESALLGRMLPDKDGILREDSTHLGRNGALLIGGWAAAELARAVPALQDDVRPAPTDAPAPGRTRWEREANRKHAMVQSVAWFENEPLAFILRRGGTPEEPPGLFNWPSVSVGAVPENVVELYDRQHDPENIRDMAAAGMGDAGLLHFYKGFGLDFERGEIGKTKRAVEIAHEYGMKVCLYVAGSMFTETFYHEVPAARNWEERDGWNRPIPYVPTQTYRHFASIYEPAYLDYLKRVIRVAVQEVHGDQLMFDNFTLQPEPDSDHSPRAIEAFHAFLRGRYPTREAAFRRFGIPDPDFIQAPEWDDPATPSTLDAITDPVLQEWIRFRCESLAKYCAELYDYAKSLNPRVAVGFNMKGLYSANRAWSAGVYHPFFAGHCDFIPFDTGGYDARIDASGALISQIRSYKMARSLGVTCVENHYMTDELNAAVCMAFNYQKPLPEVGSLAGPLLLGGDSVFTPIFEFYRHYDGRYFANTVGVADVAELRTWASMAYSVVGNYVPMTLAEQVLIQHKIPFDLLHEEQIDRIGRYGAVLLAGQDCVSQPVVDRLLRYVRQGGTLIAIGDAGAEDDWREARAHNPFLPARSEGRGKIVWIPRIIPNDRLARTVRGETLEVTAMGGPETRGKSFAPAQWVLPRNHEAIAETIGQSLPDGPALTTAAPLTTVMEMLNRAVSRETIIHFINFDPKKQLAAFPASARRQYDGPVKSVLCLSPDRDAPLPVDFQEDGDRVSFTVPAGRVYEMIVIAQ